jgi:hypothetical protein
MNMTTITEHNELSSFERFTKRSTWPAYAGFVWALLYAVFVRFYEAAGGVLDDSFDFKNGNEDFFIASYMAGVLILFCGFILLGLVKSWTKVLPTWVPLLGGMKIPYLLMLIPTLISASFLITHGFGGMLTKILYLAGVIDLQFPELIVYDMQKLALWDLLFYEPWFIIMGIFAGLTAAYFAQASGVSIVVFRRIHIVFWGFTLLLTILFVSAIVFDFVDKISF